MAKAFLSLAQHAKSKQKDLYRLLRAKKGETQTSGSALAEACGESKQTFKYRFDNELLEAWELITVLNKLGVKPEELRFIVKEGT